MRRTASPVSSSVFALLMRAAERRAPTEPGHAAHRAFRGATWTCRVCWQEAGNASRWNIDLSQQT